MKGILFTEPLFHKVVNGTKTQTRRVMKPQPQKQDCKTCDFPAGHCISWKCPDEYCKSDTVVLGKPRYKPGETLYLKEPYQKCPNRESYDPNGNGIRYKFSESHQFCEEWPEWENKLFMSERYARYFIEITGVRCERLQDISDEDCLKEGIEKQIWMNEPSVQNFYVLPDMTCELYNNPREAYANLIDKINGKGTWERNPYVWVYDFKLKNFVV